MAKCTGKFLTGVLLGAVTGAAAIYLTGPSPLLTGVPQTPSAQTEAAANKLVLDTTLRFGKAIKAHDLAGFRATTSDQFQQAFSLPAFEQAFQGFIDQQINLAAVADMKPVFATRTLDLRSNTLHLVGWFPTQPSRLSFDYNYSPVGTDWRLSGIDISVAPQ